MKAYWFDDAEGDQRLPHDSGKEVAASHLNNLGVLYSHHPTLDTVDSLASARSYKNRDEITVSPAAMGEVYETKVRSFFAEHCHEDEEIRYILDGAGYFDVRAADDASWIRIRLERGDLIVLPAGIYHRFTTDAADYIHAMRLFRDEPKWTPLNRGLDTDANPFRKGYVDSRARGEEGFLAAETV